MRRGYIRRRTKLSATFDKKQMFNVPSYFTTTKLGTVLMARTQYLQKRERILEQNRWLILSDEPNGVLLFASIIQLRAITRCHILVADATFKVVPKHFDQFLTILGLVHYIYNIKTINHLA